MKVKELINMLNKIENKELDVRIKFALDDCDEIGYYLEPFAVENMFDDEVNIYADYNITKEDCDSIGQVDLKEAYKRMLKKGNQKMEKKKTEIPKNKHIYQRCNGRITKYIVDKEYYISPDTGIAWKKSETGLLGEVSENMVDLIEEGDILKYRLKGLKHEYITVVKKYDDARSNKDWLLINGYKLEQVEILEVLTKEQYKTGCYKIGRK